MAWNPSPAVQVARDASKALGGTPLTIVVYVTPDGTQLGVASYGEDRPTCAHAKKLADRLYAAAMDWVTRHGAVP
jgi:hypothetical protein